MEKTIIIKDRIKALPFNQIEDAMKEAKTGTANKTSFGIRIKRLQNLLILL